ncbi:hypothetical protein OH736_45510 (plasmid) [Streptomyces sp. NBC_01650]|uniref:hypothetical protein n=1 Tax=Streptomyces sp. NBC_01650 TaxID=2975907 RepID=UPI002F90BC29|nr:hypothetical protein OH736_45510 [Streptomyces sp. NBC_01650]
MAGLDDDGGLRTPGVVRGLLGLGTLSALCQSPDPFLACLGLGGGLGERLLGLLAARVAG